MSDGREQAMARMRSAGVSDAAVAVFGRLYDDLASGHTGLVPEESIEPVTDLPHYEDLPDVEGHEALDATVVIRLNGGLGTSMGMTRAKSLLPVRDGLTFLDIVVRQVLVTRRASGARLPLLLLDSAHTHDDTMAALTAYPELDAGLPLALAQSREPKLAGLAPVSWPTRPDLEWCPPGHGDLYPTLHASGLLPRLLDAGYRHLFVANGDNLGASVDGRIAAWFAASGAPYVAEVTARTAMDRKGGHLARRRADGRLVLRDTAQTPTEDLRWFTDETRHPFAHCNSLWLDVEALHAALQVRDGDLGLPLIRNEKTVDPRDPASPAVVQVETAMGAAVEVFEGASALVVPRSRFLPVKGTSELLLVRSDVFELRDAHLTMAASRAGRAPVVDLAAECYRRIDDFEERFPAGPPSLVGAQAFTVEGDYVVEAGTVVEGEVRLPPTDAQQRVGGRLKSGRA